MSLVDLLVRPVSRPHPLAAGLGAALLLTTSASAPAATTWLVNTCADSNASCGTTCSLRYAVNNAVAGDIIDMTALGCSQITLLTGALVINVSPLSIHGPTSHQVTIDASVAGSRVMEHGVAGGKLYLDHVALSHGTIAPASGIAAGGCLYSKGDVSLDHVEIYGCTASSTGTDSAKGGAVYTPGSATISYSSIHDNTAVATGTGDAYGGAFANNVSPTAQFTVSSSTFSGNAASVGSPVHFARGGALRLFEGGTITGSTFSNNSATFAGAILVSRTGPSPFKLINSTVSGNTVSGNASGILAGGIDTTVANSTIAFNTSTNASPSNIPPLAALVVDGSTVALTLQSNLIANNLDANASPAENDVGYVSQQPVVSGSNNLIGGAFQNLATTWGTGTISGACPQLGPLRDNGGPTWTHALLSGSPAIDAGNNAFNQDYDQRGFDPLLPFVGYVRASGSTDIGAYEWQAGDNLFVAGFDGCPAL